MTRTLSPLARTRERPPSLLGRFGRLLRSPFDPIADPAIDRWFGRGVVICFVLLAVVPVIGGLALVAVIARPIFMRRAQMRAEHDAIIAQLPELADLYGIALRSGHNVATATAEVVRWGRGSVIDGLDHCLEQNAQGHPLSDALEDLPGRLGESVRPLVRVLVASDRDGASIVGPLSQLAADFRLRRRRAAEITARRIPIAMLFPLVVCILPAFMLLTVVPTLIDALSSLDT